MVLEALKVLALGMLGIFFVMGLIFISIKFLNFSDKSTDKTDIEKNIDDDDKI
jgi:hypothetical protein